MYFQYSKVRKQVFLYYLPYFASKSLACFLKFSAFLPDFYHSSRIAPLCMVGSKIRVKSKFVVFPTPLPVLVLLVCMAIYVVMYPKKEQPTFAADISSAKQTFAQSKKK